MALFKIFNNANTKNSLPTTYNEGYCYFDVNTGKFYIDTSDNAAGRIPISGEMADKLRTPRTITLNGDVTGSTTFDGSGNVTITTEVAADSHEHNSQYLRRDGANYMKGDIDVVAGSENRYLAFWSAFNNTSNWRLGYQGEGTGETNYFVLQSSKDTIDTWTDALKFGNRTLDATFAGNVTAASFIGNADTATKFKTAQTITVAGDATGSVTFDGSEAKTLSLDVGSADQLSSNYKINGTAFNGSKDITTASWGTARNVSITDGTNTGTTTSMGAATSGSYSLKLPTTIKATIDGNASSATKLATARTISLAGDATGSTSFDGTGNVTINTEVANDSHDHTFLLLKGTLTNQDLNDYFNDRFEVYRAGGGNTVKNNPGGDGSAFGVLCYPNASGYRTQELTSQSGIKYIRYSQGTTNTTWQPWKQVAFITDNVASASKWATARTLTLAGGATGSTSIDGSADKSITVTVVNDGHRHSNSTIDNLDASKITSGTISIDRLPQGALERLVVVADDTARFKLTTSNVQLGDVVKVTATDVMYFVKDTANLGNANGYELFAAGRAASVNWANIQNVPTLNFSGDVTGSIALAGEAVNGKSVSITVGQAAQLTTARNINGTAFNGTKAITTATWGTARNVTIKDADNTNAGAATAMGASTSDYVLHLPSTIKASLSGNAATATKFATARDIALGGDVTGTATAFDGTKAITISTVVNSAQTGFAVNAASSNASLVVMSLMRPGTVSSWRFRNQGGVFYLDNNYTTTKTDWFAVMTVNYNTGNTVFEGTVTAPKFIGALQGNADTATKWATARTLTLSGDVTGSVSIDGDANMTLTTTVADESHYHDTTYLRRDGANYITGDLVVAAGNTDKYFEFTSSTAGVKDATHSWRMSYLGTGSGNANYLAFQTTGVTTNTWTNALYIAPETLAATFAGTVTATAFSGNATSASKWATARTITVAGDATGSVSIDGSANETLTLDVATAAKTDYALTVNVTNVAGALTTTTFNGSAAKTININASDFMPLTSFTKTLTLKTDWQDIGISSNNIPNSGSYIIQVLVNDGGTTGTLSNYSEYYTGTMSWYASNTNSTDTDEIILHKAGHASNSRYIYLRTIRTSAGVLKMQIAANVTATAASTLVIKVRQLI